MYTGDMNKLSTRAQVILGVLVLVGAIIVAVVAFNSMQSAKDVVVVITPTETPAATVEPSAPETEAPVEVPAPADDAYGQAEAFVSTLPVTTTAPTTKYQREPQFGKAWIDVDGNGCDTRNDILKRDFETYVVFRGDCEVQTGVLNDPYTGTTINFTHTNAFGKNTGDSMAVQIDHMIPLNWAWQNGAENWDQDTRILFANDPINLKAVEGKQNGSKSDQGPSAWMPASQAYHCTYAVEFTSVLQKYELTIPAADQQALLGVLAGC